MSERTCNDCQRVLPLESFRRCGAGWSHRCPACTGSTHMVSPGRFFCLACREVKPKAEFLQDKRKPSGIRSICKLCYRRRYTSYRNAYRRERGYLERRRYFARAFRLRHALPSVLRDPSHETFSTESFEAESQSLVGAGQERLGAALRHASLRGIWEGYQRAMRSLKAYGPPPDVGELREALRVAEIEPEYWPEGERVRRRPAPVRPEPLPEWDMPFELERLKRLALERALKMTGWNIARTARLLGVSRTGVYVLMTRYGKESPSGPQSLPEPPESLQEEGEPFDPLEAEVDQVLSEAI